MEILTMAGNDPAERIDASDWLQMLLPLESGGGGFPADFEEQGGGRKMPRNSGVKRLLITGTDDSLFEFHLIMSQQMNVVDRRGQTVMYTCFDDDYDAAIGAARAAEVTVQEWDGKGWAVTFQGPTEAWEPEKLVLH